MDYRRSPALVALLTAIIAVPSPALAHNESVHQRMTDYAYHVMLAAKAHREGGDMPESLRALLQRLEQEQPGMRRFYAAAVDSVRRLKAMKSGLPADDTPCLTPGLIAQVGGGAPNWQLPAGTAIITDARMEDVRLPVTKDYGYGTAVCGLDEGWAPSGVLAAVNPGIWLTRDHTGTTLGYWSAAPDKEVKDWVLRSTTLEVIQHPAVVSAIGAGTTVAVSVVCAIACGLFPIACALCPAVAVGAGVVVIDEITSIDADSLESEDYVGFGHFIDMKPTSAASTFFDEKPAKFMERAGPAGVADPTESIVIALFHLLGVHVNHDESLAPKNYEILQGSSGGPGPDFHQNTTDRAPSAWESPKLPNLQLTAVDNLGMFGYIEAKAARGTTKEAYRLGWPLHAIGDAAVPMHAVGASGYGHRPYEDAVDMVYDNLVGSSVTTASLSTVTQVLVRGLKWRTFIQNWRAAHGGTTEVPVRDLITAVANTARQKATAQPSVFKPERSLQYIVDEDGATAAYDNPAMAAIQRDLLIEAIAAEMAFLVSVTEVQP
jgi:hypothetical protein